METWGRFAFRLRLTSAVEEARPTENPGLVTRGMWFARRLGGLVQYCGIDTNVPHGVRIDVMTGQQAVLIGTEQALHGVQNSFGEAGVVLRVHGCIPWGLGVCAVLL